MLIEKFTIRLIVLMLFFLHCRYSNAQQIFSNNRSKIVALTSDSTKLDSLSIFPSSFLLTNANGKLVDSLDYHIDYLTATLIWLSDTIPGLIKVDYKVLPYDFGKEFRHKNIKEIYQQKNGITDPFKISYSSKNNDLLNINGLNKQGSISRGVSFGNNQDLAVNSSLNLQLSGKVGEDISILAAITDDNIPIQPEGNTQQLQDFDQIYIQLFNDKWKLTAGDFQIRSPKNSTYMKYFKKAQGASIDTKFKLTEENGGGNMDVRFSAAVSRGKFARNIIQGVEGNQGPYRLNGAENEAFIIILSGTERVYIDGEELVRGQENDYVIDYNTAEITFTAKRLITKDKRISVEFQYSDRNYSRSLIDVTSLYAKDKLDLYFSIFSEQDHKNQPVLQDLTDQQKNVLANIGDSLSQAIVTNFDSVGFADDEIRYKLLVINGDSVFQYSTNPDSAVYRLGFSQVGINNGDYIPIQSNANGRVFEWIKPDTLNDGTIIRNGRYEPVILLVTPKKRQMAILGGNYKLSNTSNISFEGALSNNDLNTFSNLHGNDNIGYALKLNYAGEKLIGQHEKLKLVSQVSYEQINKDFQEIERFRGVEFFRSWNLRGVELKENQHIAGASVGLNKKESGRLLGYQFHSFIGEQNEFRGFQNEINSNFKENGLKVDMRGSLMTAKSAVNSSLFIRNKGLISKSVGNLVVGAKNDFEHNLFRDNITDSLLGNSYQFIDWEVFVASNDSAINKYRLSYGKRIDNVLKLNSLTKATLGENVSFSFELLKKRNSILKGKSTYRRLFIKDSTLTNNKKDNTILNRVEYNLRLLNGIVASSSFYEIGSGLEARRALSYLEVAAGQGTHTHVESNDTPDIKELGEFVPYKFKDQANYIPVFTTTNEFVKTLTNQFSQQFFIKPAIKWRSKTGIKKFAARFSDQLTFRTDRKVTEGQFAEVVNPFSDKVNDTTLVSINSSFRNTLYFNQTDPKFGANYNYQLLKNKTLLTNGFESRTNTFQELIARWNITRKIALNLKGKLGEKSNNSESFEQRNFLINYSQIEPKISYQPGTTFRLSLLTDYTNKKDLVSQTRAVNQKIGSEIKWNTVGKGSLLLQVNYIKISYDVKDLTSAFLSFEMLEGLQQGNNAVWDVVYQQTLSNNLQLSLNYNGRSSENIKVIHSGGVQVRAFF